jgi:hypothetical protein
VVVETIVVAALIGFAAKVIQGRRRGGAPMPGTGTGTPPSGQSPVTISNRVMRGPTGATYTLTDDDLLWLARAIKGEAESSVPGGTAVAWALAQNFLLVGRRPPRMTPFSLLIRRYCQPVNPAWADPNGAKWSAIPASIRDIVQRFAAGTLPNPIPGMTDWATPRWRADNVEIDGNFFGRNPNRTYAA